MAEEIVQRKLVAIMALDVAGYSRLMGEDEVGTLRALKGIRSGIVEPAVAEHGGRIFKLMGDGALVEFRSALDAINGALAIQRGMRSASYGMELRIGVNLGDVIVEGRDLYGDGVNIAARLEGLAEPGGICVSEKVYTEVRKKTDLGFKDIGEQQLKNIAALVRAYQIDLVAEVPLSKSADAITTRPAVAVLPFTNLSGDPEQEYFSDGLTEDIITGLANWLTFPVIARNSSFAYKGKAKDVRQIAGELNALYVVEGSVRRGANRIRIAAQLIDTDTGHHVWADTFDRELSDVFAVQDEITRLIVASVEPEISKAVLRKLRSRHPASVDAWEYSERGWAMFYEETQESVAEARSLFKKAIKLDRTYVRALVGLAMTHHHPKP